MKWCNVNGQIFDRSKVCHFRMNDNHLMAVFGENADNGMAALHEISVATFERDLNIEEFNGKVDALVEEIVTGVYDIPGQSNFIAVHTKDWHEVEYINMDLVVHINNSMGGLDIKLADGSKFNIESVHDKSHDHELESFNAIMRHVGEKTFNPPKPGEVLLLKLHKTSLTWNTEKVYEQRMKGNLLKYWVVGEKGNAYRLMFENKQITNKTIGGLVDMASSKEETPFEGTVDLVG